MAAQDLVPALQTAIAGFNTIVDGKQQTVDAKLPTAQTALDGARLARDEALVARDTTIASRDAAYRDLRSAQANLDHQDLAALAASKPVNAVDVFIYDTSKDSDGGAWRKRCAKTSWFNEPLMTLTRGARREFPAVAILILETNDTGQPALTIYDGDDPSLPMWMVFHAGGASGVSETNNMLGTPAQADRTFTSVCALNGVIAVGLKHATISAYGYLHVVNFAADDARSVNDNSLRSGKYRGGIAWRNARLGLAPGDANVIVSGAVNDIAMTVLPGAPTDLATRLPIPTIAVATDNGVSVINHDGAVVDSAVTSAKTVNFFPNGDLLALETSGANEVVFFEDYGADGFTHAGRDYFAISVVPQNKMFDPIPIGVAEIAANGRNIVGLQRIIERPDDPQSGLHALTSSVFTTGWLPGAVKGVFLADTNTTDLVGGTDADRSVQSNPLTVNGTITRAPVAPGAELVAYSGFGVGDYMHQPYNADLQFRAGDFCIIGWTAITSGVHYVIDRSREGGGNRIYVICDENNGRVSFGFPNGAIYSEGLPSIGSWAHVVCLRRNGVRQIFINGRLFGADANNFDFVDDGTEQLFVGTRYSDAQHARSLALLRISASAPTADQIAKIYSDEKVLFQQNAACTLYGASDAVTALAHDPHTGLLHVGTSAGRSVFKGLRRVDNTTQAVTTAISVANGMVIEQ